MANARMQLISRKKGQALKRDIQLIVAFAYKAVKRYNGIIQATGRSAYLLYYQKSRFRLSLIDKIRYLQIAISVVGISRLRETLARERLVREIRSTARRRYGDRDYLYVWFLAQQRTRDISGLVELKQRIMALAHQRGIPIYMETTEERLVNVYRRIGFDFYQQVSPSSDGSTIWFGRYDCTTKIK